MTRSRTPTSVEHFAEMLAEAFVGAGEGGKLGRGAVLHALRQVVFSKTCQLCGAARGVLCHVYGGVNYLERTHPVRLKVTATEARDLAGMAILHAGDDPADGMGHNGGASPYYVQCVKACGNTRPRKVINRSTE